MPKPAKWHIGQVVLVHVVFSDQTAGKVRPACVLHAAGDGDLLVAPITSHAPRGGFDVVVEDWRQSGLRLPSVVRVDKLATVSHGVVVSLLGWLSQRDGAAVLAACHGMAADLSLGMASLAAR